MSFHSETFWFSSLNASCISVYSTRLILFVTKSIEIEGMCRILKCLVWCISQRPASNAFWLWWINSKFVLNLYLHHRTHIILDWSNNIHCTLLGCHSKQCTKLRICHHTFPNWNSIEPDFKLCVLQLNTHEYIWNNLILRDAVCVHLRFCTHFTPIRKLYCSSID